MPPQPQRLRRHIVLDLRNTPVPAAGEGVELVEVGESVSAAGTCAAVSGVSPSHGTVCASCVPISEGRYASLEYRYTRGAVGASVPFAKENSGAWEWSGGWPFAGGTEGGTGREGRLTVLDNVVRDAGRDVCGGVACRRKRHGEGYQNGCNNF